jgi:anti-anti-sigma regulatory factor
VAEPRNWPALHDTRSAERSRSLYRAAVRAAHRQLARLPGLAFAPWAGRSLSRPVEEVATCGPASTGLVIQRRHYASGLHLIASGALDSASAPQLEQQCQRIDPHEAHTVLLDLADLTLIDGSGLDVLFTVYAHLGERLVIIIGPPVAHTVERANVRNQLPIIEG